MEPNDDTKTRPELRKQWLEDRAKTTMSKLDELIQELDDAYYDNRVRHLEAIKELRIYLDGLRYHIDLVDENFYQDSFDSRKAIDALLVYTKVEVHRT